MDDGYINRRRKMILDNIAISIREDEGSGGLIYYNGKRFIGIYQRD